MRWAISGYPSYDIYISDPYYLRINRNYDISKVVGYFRSAHYQLGFSFHRYDFTSSKRCSEKISFWCYEGFVGHRTRNNLIYSLPYSLVFSNVL